MAAIGILHRRSGEGLPMEWLGPYGIETLIPREAEQAMTAYRVRIEPHQRTAVSYHRVAEELYFVLSGRGAAILDGVAYGIGVGDFLRLPPGTRHGFITEDEALEMLDIHAPGSRPDRDVFFDGAAPEGFGEAGG